MNDEIIVTFCRIDYSPAAAVGMRGEFVRWTGSTNSIAVCKFPFGNYYVHASDFKFAAMTPFATDLRAYLQEELSD